MKTKPLSWQLQRHPALIYETHAVLGEYVYSSSINSWSHFREMMNGERLLLRGRGRTPSAEQIILWDNIDSHLHELTAKAISTIDPKIMESKWFIFHTTKTFSRDELVLQEVQLEEDGSFEFFFDTPISDKHNIWPMVTFHGSDVVKSEWTC